MQSSVAAGTLLMALVAAGPILAFAQDPVAPAAAPQPPGACIALVLPSVQGVEGNATQMASGVRDLFSSYLTGPSIRSLAIDARLPSQASEEARVKDCPYLLTSTLTFKRNGGGGLARALGRAAGAAAWHVPYAGTAAGAAARSAAISGAYAAASIAETTREKDEVTLDFKLTALAGGKVLAGKSDKAKAKRNGEDLLTGLVERASQSALDAVARK